MRVLTLGLILLAAVGRAHAQLPEVVVTETGMQGFFYSSGSYDSLVWTRAQASCPGGEIAPACQARATYVSNTPPVPLSYYRTVYENTGPTDARSVHSRILGMNGTDMFWLGDTEVLSHGVRSGVSATTNVLASYTGTLSPESDEIAADGSWVYWTENTASSGRLYRAPRGGGTRELVHENTVAPLTQLSVDRRGGVLFVSTVTPVFAFDVLHRIVEDGVGGFTVQLGPGAIHSYTYAAGDLSFLAAQGSGSARVLYRMDRDDISSFASGITLVAGSEDADVPLMAADGDHVYYFKRESPSGQTFLFRMPVDEFDTGTPTPLTTARLGVQDLRMSYDHVLWREGIQIWRLSKEDAVALEADTAVTHVEVTQGIQDTTNGEDLVADKPTFLRVMLAASGVTGVGQVNSRVRVRGFDALDAPLPGPPPRPQVLALAEGSSNRADPTTTLQFELPAAWLTGTVRLEVEIENLTLRDPNPANNEWTQGGFQFRPKTHVCVKFMPIETSSGPTYRVRELDTGRFTPGFLDIARRFETLWPTRKLLFYTQIVAMRKPKVLGPSTPFVMTGSADSDNLIGALWEHNLWDGAPDWCGGDNARTHYVAMLHPSINTTTATGSERLGTGSFGEPLSWVKMKTDGNAFTAPRGGGTLAHELTHNYNNLFGNDNPYQHVNCGLTSGDFNELYPYDPCSIGLDAPPGSDPGWGWDRVSGSAIEPNEAADFMSYRTPAWTSDYRWDLLVNKLQDRSGSPARAAPTAQSAPPVSNVLTVFGRVAADEASGEFLSAAHVPPGLTVPETNTGGGGSNGATGTFELRILDGDLNLLQTTPVVPTSPDAGEDVNGDFFFFATAPFPAGAQQIQLVRNPSELLSTLTPSNNAPTVAIVAPIAGETVGDELHVKWVGSDLDGDDLSYLVQYRASDGFPWTLIASRISETSITIPTTGLRGSVKAEIRVIANDGLLLGSATVGPFTLEDRPPDAILMQPRDGSTYRVGETVTLEGYGIDPEDGELLGDDLTWNLVGPFSGSAFGEHLFVDDLPPGPYDVELQAKDGLGQAGTATASFVVGTKGVPNAPTPFLDGRCVDGSYDNDTEPLQIHYPGGGSAALRAVRDAQNVYVCVEGLAQPTDPSANVLCLYFDANDSSEASVQPGDFGVCTSESGVVSTTSGSNGDYSPDPAPAGADAGVALLESSWSAEFVIGPSRLGKSPFAGLRVVHDGFKAGPVVGWPLGGDTDVPASYGTVVFGEQAQTVSFPEPPDQYTGAPDFPASATASSGLPVTVTSLTPASCSVTLGGDVASLLPGSCTLRATQPGNQSFAAATPVERSFEVVPVDSDGDGVLELDDNCVELANPDQADADAGVDDDDSQAGVQHYGNRCDPDLNNDGVVNFLDLGLLKAIFFSKEERGDFNGDGTVNFLDLGIMKSFFFDAPGPGYTEPAIGAGASTSTEATAAIPALHGLGLALLATLVLLAAVIRTRCA